MKLVIFVLSFLAVLYCASSDDNKKNYHKYDSQEVEEKDYPTVEYPTPDAEVTPQSLPTAPSSTIRMRRSPPRFDPNKMKGKFTKVLRKKRDIDIGKTFKRIQDYVGGRKKRYIPDDTEPSPLKLMSETTETRLLE